ncbi:MAG TPA: hypothetical protein VE244_05745 [Nitrososphaeraceae archaeon]|nr:hypothetical protein [Nitrososphaeraceae archaeon]
MQSIIIIIIAKECVINKLALLTISSVDDDDVEVSIVEKQQSSKYKKLKLFSLIQESKNQKYEDNEEKTAEITITTNPTFFELLYHIYTHSFFSHISFS